MFAKGKAKDSCSATVTATRQCGDGAKLGGVFKVWCHDKNGNLKWYDEAPNLIVNVGLYHFLDTELCGASAVTTWYLGLLSSTPTVAAADTMASHSGWTEVTTYDESVRQTYTETRTTNNVSNSASKAVFTISGTVSVGGAFMCSSATKSESASVLMCGAAFSGGNKAVVDNDVLNVQYDVSLADDAV
jgi:hypothetical protein